MKTKRGRHRGLLSMVILTAILVGFIGCEQKEETVTKLKELDYTVVEEGNVPEEFLAVINEKKLAPFRMSYLTNGYYYMAEGYGTQKSGGYSIRVKELYEADKGILFETELIGPGKDEAVTQLETHPYIVVKIKDIGQEMLERK